MTELCSIELQSAEVSDTTKVDSSNKARDKFVKPLYLPFPFRFLMFFFTSSEQCSMI
jgi:hypothetical protein